MQFYMACWAKQERNGAKSTGYKVSITGQFAVNGWNIASSGGTTDVVAREFIPLQYRNQGKCVVQFILI